MVVVLASGAFDLLHYGHIRFLEEAKKLGGASSKLVVIVASDETVKQNKGKKPVIPEDQRRAIVEALKVVDEALLGYENADFGAVIERIKPDIIAIGFDQDEVERETMKTIKEKGLNIRVVKLGRFGREDLNSSSKIKRKIVEDYVKA
ncbi:FAD synthase [Candidatus Bathyarchaeota archaeon]|nr:FAD synthase [Candidatus Bathyarchaeota archaeon]MBS7631742.1 FAD synthase [Candidatus Bathyarchaeota archaeon]